MADSNRTVGRFAPSTTGPAHPGTMLAALLCWLDIRSRGGRIVLRLEDLDPERSRPGYVDAMLRDLAWLGFDFDLVERQSAFASRHEAALDSLAAEGRLYPCACSRTDLRAAGFRGADGGFRYTGRCRGRPLPEGGWRASDEPLRALLDAGSIAITDESGRDLSQDPAAALGDPIVRRRDGAIAYALAAVVDDAAAGVSRVVRGHDLAVTTATQHALRSLLALELPVHRHHFLLLESHRGKLAKLHGSVSIDELRTTYDAPRLLGTLARMAGLVSEGVTPTPGALAAAFSWERVRREDLAVQWTSGRFEALGG